MAFKTCLTFHSIFHLLCLVIAFGLTLKCLVKFLENNNLSSLNYKKFHKNEYHIYPSMSWCIIYPFNENELKKYGKDINVTSYSEFLQGRHWDEKMIDIDFDKVTTSLADNLLESWLLLHDDTVYHYNQSTKTSDPSGWVPNFYVSFRSSIRKCFTFDMPFMEQQPVNIFGLAMKNEFFPRGVRPTANDKDRFYVYLHYPGQRFTSIYTLKYDWELKSNQSNPYNMQYEVRDVEVNRHRVRSQQPCIEDWRNYDKILMDDIMFEAGCRPPHWETTHNLSLCSESKQMTYIADQPTTAYVEAFGPPCTVIENLQYRYYEQDYSSAGKYS